MSPDVLAIAFLVLFAGMVWIARRLNESSD